MARPHSIDTSQLPWPDSQTPFHNIYWTTAMANSIPPSILNKCHGQTLFHHLHQTTAMARLHSTIRMRQLHTTTRLHSTIIYWTSATARFHSTIYTGQLPYPDFIPPTILDKCQAYWQAVLTPVTAHLTIRLTEPHSWPCVFLLRCKTNNNTLQKTLLCVHTKVTSRSRSKHGLIHRLFL